MQEVFALFSLPSIYLLGAELPYVLHSLEGVYVPRDRKTPDLPFLFSLSFVSLLVVV